MASKKKRVTPFERETQRILLRFGTMANGEQLLLEEVADAAAELLRAGGGRNRLTKAQRKQRLRASLEVLEVVRAKRRAA